MAERTAWRICRDNGWWSEERLAGGAEGWHGQVRATTRAARRPHDLATVPLRGERIQIADTLQRWTRPDRHRTRAGSGAADDQPRAPPQPARLRSISAVPRALGGGDQAASRPPLNCQRTRRCAHSCSRDCKSGGARSRSPVPSGSPIRVSRAREWRPRRSIGQALASCANQHPRHCAPDAIIDAGRADRSALGDDSRSQCSPSTTGASSRPIGQSPATGRGTSSSDRATAQLSARSSNDRPGS